MSGGVVPRDEEERVHLQEQFPDENIEVGCRFALEPCLPVDHLNAIYETTGGEQLCPKVDLRSDNMVAGKLAIMFAHPRNGVHAMEFLDVYMPRDEYSDEERIRVLERAMVGGDILYSLTTEKARAQAGSGKK